MKKVLLISASALALSAGAAFAQVTPGQGPTSLDMGTSQPFYASGSLTPGSTTYVQQIGDENKIQANTANSPGGAKGVDQTIDNSEGAANYSEIYQGYSSGGEMQTSSTSSSAGVYPA